MGWWRPQSRVTPPESPDQRRERRKLELIGGPLVIFTGGMLIYYSAQAFLRDGWLAELNIGTSVHRDWWAFDFGMGVLAVIGGGWALWARLRER